MKKLALVLSIFLCLSVAVVAQPKAIGLRMGWNWEASYQHSFGSSAFLQLDAGTFNAFHGLNFSPTVNFIFATPKWTPKGTWEWYAGPGISTGYDFGYRYTSSSITDKRYGNYFYLGLSGMVGLSYTFWFPLQLSVDFRPTLIGFQTVDTDYYVLQGKTAVYSDFWWNKDVYRDRAFYPNIALSVRYSFGK
ncbi:MAG: hypothetical protein LBV69_02300 [Bacteroidales bacterium]|nr:hypothetical protein [Bacteroidales bacterium]